MLLFFLLHVVCSWAPTCAHDSEQILAFVSLSRAGSRVWVANYNGFDLIAYVCTFWQHMAMRNGIVCIKISCIFLMIILTFFMFKNCRVIFGLAFIYILSRFHLIIIAKTTDLVI